MKKSISRRNMVATSAAAFAGFFIAGMNSLAGENPHTQADFELNDPGVSTFTMSGTERHFGRFSAFGEMDVRAGQGVAVLTAANGDQIVGVVEAAAVGDRTKGHFHFSWRDSVTFEDGTVHVNTGRFARQRPPGVVTLAVIAPPVGRLLPYIEQDN
jgi:hypothetical protein